MSEYKFVVTGDPAEMLEDALNGATFGFAVVGLASGDEPGLIVMGGNLADDKTGVCGAFVPYEWRALGNLPASFAFVTQCQPAITGVAFSIEPLFVKKYTEHATAHIRNISLSPINFQAKEYQGLWSGNDALPSNDDLLALAGDLDIETDDVALVPIHAGEKLSSRDDEFVAKFAQAFLSELIKQLIESKFIEKVEGPLEAAKQYVACLHNDVDPMQYAVMKALDGIVGVETDDETIPLRGEIDGPIENLYSIAWDLGVGPSFLLEDKLNTERLDKFIKDLLLSLPNVGKDKLYFIYHGFDALIQRERAKLFVDSDGHGVVDSRLVYASEDNTPMFGKFSMN